MDLIRWRRPLEADRLIARLRRRDLQNITVQSVQQVIVNSQRALIRQATLAVRVSDQEKRRELVEK